MRNKVKLRKFPYPYRAACTICNDIDRTDWDTFVYIHKLINIDLGLEMGDSFWMYSVKPDVDDAFSYFDGLSNNTSHYAKKIIDLIKLGYLDCLHTYGNFSQKGGFKRAFATQALGELKAKGACPLVWVDHGDAHNLQNIGKHGDLPFTVAADGTKTKVNEYHTDLLIDSGIRYLWNNKLTAIVGQDRNYSIFSYLLATGHRPLRIVKQLLRLIRAKLTGKNVLANQLLVPWELRAGQTVYGFRRFGEWEKGSPSALPELLSKKNLSTLVKNQGYMLVYNHLGKETCVGKGLHTDTNINALRNLSENYKAGNILVATTTRLLQYNMVWHGLAWEAMLRDGGLVINLKGIKDQVFGDVPLNEEWLQGITFEVPEPKQTELLINGNKVVNVIRSKNTIGIKFERLPTDELKKVLGI